MTKTKDPLIDLAWNTFRYHFKDGERVIVEDSDGVFYYGKLKASNAYCHIIRSEQKNVSLWWEDIEFIAHDGFPVRRLARMTAAEAERRAEQEPTEVVVAALNGELKQKPPREPKPGVLKRVGDYIDSLPEPAGGLWCGGCPFIAGPAELIEILNRGNRGPRWHGSDLCETLIFRSDDGAILHNYDSDHLFLRA